MNSTSPKVLKAHGELVVNKEENLSLFESIPFYPEYPSKFKFIDLFAGIGGFRLALQNLGGECVFSSEIDLYAQKTYSVNFGETPYGDITLESTKNAIPDHFDLDLKIHAVRYFLTLRIL